MFLDGCGPSFLVNKVYRPTVRESKTVLDSGFHAGDSWFQVLDPSLCQWNLDSGFQVRFNAIPDSWAVLWIQKPRIPDSTSKNFPDSRNQIHRLHEMRLRKALNSALHETRDFETPRRRRQQERQKSNWLNKQNNNSARASRFFVHFFTVTARLRRENA